MGSQKSTLNKQKKKHYASTQIIPSQVFILNFFTTPLNDMRPKICPYGRLLPTIGNGFNMFID